MCIVCVLWDKERLTRREAESAFSEIVKDKDFDLNHVKEFEKKVEEAIIKENEEKS
jgi:hypothetical protein